MRESILCSRCPPRRGNPNRPELAHLTATKWNTSDDLFRGIGLHRETARSGRSPPKMVMDCTGANLRLRPSGF